MSKYLNISGRTLTIMKVYHSPVVTGQPDPALQTPGIPGEYSTINYVCKEADHYDNGTFIYPHGEIVNINKRNNVNVNKIPNIKKISNHKSQSCLIGCIKFLQQHYLQIKKKPETQIMFVHEDVAAAMKQLKCDVERFLQFEKSNDIFQIAKIDGESVNTILARMSIKIYEIEERLMRKDVPTCGEVLLSSENTLKLIRSLQQSISAFFEAEVEALKQRRSKLCDLLTYLLNIEKEFHYITRSVKQQCCNKDENEAMSLFNTSSLLTKAFEGLSKQCTTVKDSVCPFDESRKNSIDETNVNNATCSKECSPFDKLKMFSFGVSDKKNEKDLIGNSRFDETESILVNQCCIRNERRSKSCDLFHKIKKISGDKSSTKDAAAFKRFSIIDTPKYIDKFCAIKIATDLIEKSKEDYKPDFITQEPKGFDKSCTNNGIGSKRSCIVVRDNLVDKSSSKVLKRVSFIDEPINISYNESDTKNGLESKTSSHKDQQISNDEALNFENSFFLNKKTYSFTNKQPATELSSFTDRGSNMQCNLTDPGSESSYSRLYEINPNTVRSDRTLNTAWQEVIYEKVPCQIRSQEEGDSVCERRPTTSDECSCSVSKSEEVRESMGDIPNIWYESARQLLHWPGVFR